MGQLPVSGGPHYISTGTLVCCSWNINGLTDLKQALKFLERNQTRFPFHDLVNAIFPLEQAEKAFEVGRDLRPIRVAITCKA